MKIGVVLPQQHIGDDPAVLREFALTAESLGFSHIIAYDHVLGAQHAGRNPPLTGPYTEDDAFHEVLTLFAWWAAMTEHIELMPGVLVLPQRQTALAAKQVAEIDLLSGGRVRLGVGSGWNHVEYESLGVDFRRRGARLEEQVQLLRRLWTERVIDFTGSFHRVDRAGLLPLPKRAVPIWFGGYADAALDRCARIGDGFLFSRSSSGALQRLERLRDRVAEAGRDPGAVGYEAILPGDATEWPALVDEWRDAGGTHVAVLPSGDGAGIVTDLHRCREALTSQFG